jgi:hypothetical protein
MYDAQPPGLSHVMEIDCMKRRYICFLLGIMPIPLAGTSCDFLGDSTGFPKTANWTQRTVNDNASVRPTVVAAFDFDNDGHPDVAAGYAGDGAHTPAVFIHFQTDVDNFTAVQVASSADLSGITALAVGDLDGDGHRDLVAACNGRLIYLHSGADPRQGGDWTTNIIAESDDAAFGQWNDVVIGSIDGANGPDLVACNANPGRVCWFVSPSSSITNGAGWTRVDVDVTTRSNAAGVVLDDFDADGRLDIISTAPGETGARIAWYSNPDDPAADTWTKSTVGNLPACTRVITTDLNADGRTDVVAINPTGRQIGWYQRPSDATTTWSGFLITQYTTNQPSDVKAADVDGNNQIDLIAGTLSNGSLRWFTPTPNQNQTVQWVENNLDDLNFTVGRIAIADFDGDGRPDVVAPLQGSAAAQDEIAWFENPEP